MLRKNSNSRVFPHRSECRRDWLVCEETFSPRRYRANLPSRLRPSLFGSD
jgi:hypothetical protein